MTTHDITLDFSNPGADVQTGIVIKRRDYGSHVFNFTLMDGETPVSLTENQSLRVKICRDDGYTNESVQLIDTVYEVELADIDFPGDVKGEVSLYDDESRITTCAFMFNVVRDINTDGTAAADPGLPIIDKLIRDTRELNQHATDDANRAEAARDRAEEAADETEADRQEVAANTEAVAIKHAEVLSKALEVIADRIRAEAAAGNAEASEIITQQAMSDLLAMMGTDVATLTNGKLTPSQIPAIAIVNTSVVSSEAEMLALTAQTGDVAIRTDESKSYILQGADPSVLTDWQYLQTPTNYADTAGHALTADEAENATKINNHRVVTMTQEQYDSAVIDPDTVYLVGG